MEDDWDLHAVVRSCTAATPTSSSTTGCGHVGSPFHPKDYIFSSDFSQDLFEGKRGNSIEELHDLYKPFFPKSQAVSSQSLPISPLSVLGGLHDLSYEQNQHQQQQLMKQLPQQTQIKQKQQPFSVIVNGTTKTHNSSSKSKRRKNTTKRVCHVAAESLSSDMWSWRKYGQKPIKGSPYPRGYYRCSTSKGCMARKQVERNRSDPGMFIVTYTAEHNHPMPTHRNSLAGSTRNKPENPSSDEPNKPSCSMEMSLAASLSPAVEKLESSRDEAEDEDDDFSVSDMALDDDFFTGLEDFTAGESFSDQFPTSPLSWLGTTTAG